MASKGRRSTIQVAVCGLTSCFYGVSGIGAGKSCLCNRFVRPNMDDFREDHTSVLDLSEFGSNVINNTHFLFWGDKIVNLEGREEVKFQILEHTEFVDDKSLRSFSSSKPYYLRCTQIKIRSGGKVTYIDPDQLALPEEYPNVGKFPDKFTVDGYVVCADVSTPFDGGFLNCLLRNIQRTKKPIVIACTKYDRVLESSVTVSALNDLVAKTKKQIPMIEVSAKEGINVDTCFLVLAHLVDTKKPKVKVLTYAESKSLFDERIRKNILRFKDILDKNVIDFSMSFDTACSILQQQAEYKLLRELSGKLRVEELIHKQLSYLKQQQIKRKLTYFTDVLPQVFQAMLPVLDLDADVKLCRQKLRVSEKFGMYFSRVEEWKEDVEFLKEESDALVPFEILWEDQIAKLLQKHIYEVVAIAREKEACKKISQTLNSYTNLKPGIRMAVLWAELGMSEVAARVSPDLLIKLYNDHMSKVEQACIADLTELCLERCDLFDQSTYPLANDTLQLIHCELQNDVRYQRLEFRPAVLKGQVLKHVGSLKMPEKSHDYAKSSLIDSIEKLEKDGTMNQGRLRSGDLQWIEDIYDICFNLALLARTNDNVKTLRSDIMNYCSGTENCAVEDQNYELIMNLFDGPAISTLTSEDFVPQGGLVVVTSMECIGWLEDLLDRLWLPTMSVESKLAPYRGMPLVILALDKEGPAATDQNSIHKRAQILANRVQCVCVTETPIPQPMRLVGTTTIRQMLLSLINGVKYTHEFLTSDIHFGNPGGLNIAVCTLVGDPYSNEALLKPWLQHQLVCCKEGHHALYLRSAIEKQHRTCTLTFHSLLNVKDISSTIKLGFILVFSCQRPASLAILKNLLPKLPNLPKLIIAITTAEMSHDLEPLEEGRKLADDWEALFVSANEEELSIGYTSEFFHKCWFSRFSSWRAQNISDNVIRGLHWRKCSITLPDRPSYTKADLPPVPHIVSPVRHSLGSVLDAMDVDKPGLSTFISSQISKNKADIDIPQGESSSHEDLSDYASVEDAVKHIKLIASRTDLSPLKRPPPRSSSMPPPPPPFSPSPENEQLACEDSDVYYATIEPHQVPAVQKEPYQKSTQALTQPVISEPGHIYSLGAPNDLTTHTWYQGRVSSEEEANQLLNSSDSDCDFIVRETGGALYLSQKNHNDVTHTLIEFGPGWYKLQGESVVEQFQSIPELIQDYCSHHQLASKSDSAGKAIASEDDQVEEGTHIYSLGAPADLLSCGWYYNEASELEAEIRLKELRCSCFLVRKSEPSLYLSSWKGHSTEVSHILIESGPGWYRLQEESLQFPSVSLLVTHYQQNAGISFEGLLGQPCLNSILVCEKPASIKLHWKRCADLPTAVTAPQVVRIGLFVYVGGGYVSRTDCAHRCLISKYDTTSDKWTVLTVCPTSVFGLAQLDGDLVIAGGRDDRDPPEVFSNKVYVLAESGSWEQTIPPLPTARCLPSAFSHESILIVAGGITRRLGSIFVKSDIVEVYQSKSCQWSKTTRLPYPISSGSGCVIAGYCYLLGGATSDPKNRFNCLYTSLSSLVDSPIHGDNECSDTASVEQIDAGYSTSAPVITSCKSWNILPEKCFCSFSTGVEIQGHLLALGGRIGDTQESMNKAMMYSLNTNSWIRIPGADLPVPLARLGIAKLEDGEIIVIGGQDRITSFSKSVHIGSLC